jgi:hypothetical protein
MLRQEMEYNRIIIGAWAHNKDDNINKVKTVNVAVDWSTNLHAVANGGHGSSLDNHSGPFEKLKNIKPVNGDIVLHSGIFIMVRVLKTPTICYR